MCVQRDCQNALESAALPHGVRTKEVEALAPPGQNWVHYLVKLQQILTVVQLPSNLRDNWSRNEQNETSRAPRSGMYV